MSITDELPTWRKTCSMCGAYYAPYCYGIELMPGSDCELERPYTTEPDSWCSLWRREPKKRVERQTMRKETRSMSITDELRKEARGFGRYVYTAPQADCLTAIADRIDAEHESAMYNMRREHDEWVADRDAKWVKLPKDANGVPLHIGDKVDSDHYEDGTVTGIQYGLAANGAIRELVAVRPHGWDTATWHDPEEYAHHHTPTVEDVLREMHAELDEVTALYVGEAIDSDERDRDEARIFAEYAAKLRLAKEGE